MNCYVRLYFHVILCPLAYLCYVCRPLSTSNVRRGYNMYLFSTLPLRAVWWNHFISVTKKKKRYRELHSLMLCCHSLLIVMTSTSKWWGRKSAHHFFIGGSFCSLATSWRDGDRGLCPQRFWFSCGGFTSIPATREAVFHHLVGSSPAPWLSPALLTTNMHNSDRRRRKWLHRIPWKTPCLSQDLSWTTAWSSFVERGKKRKRCGMQDFLPTNWRDARRAVGVTGASSSVTLLGTLSRRGSWYIAPLQWNMQAFYVLIIPPPCSADLPPGEKAKAPRSAPCQQAVICLSRAGSRDEVPHFCRSELELIVLSSSCRSQMHKGVS